MRASDIADAFDHHAWANDVLLAVCQDLSEEQLSAPVPGTYGSILDMARHIVGADDWYLYVFSGGTRARIDEDAMSIPELREAARGYAADYRALLAEGRDPGEDVTITESANVWHATRGIRLAQIVHHGTDHRSQICTGLTALGIEPPDIDVWAYGEQAGLVRDEPRAD